MAASCLSLQIETALPLESIAEAHEVVEAGNVAGRVVVTPLAASGR